MKLVTLVLSLTATACLSLGCSHSADRPGSAGGDGGGYTVPVGTVSTPEPCVPPTEGCPCTEPGKKGTCKAHLLQFGSFVFCGGEHTCDAQTGTWSACVPAVDFSTADSGH